ncbi:ankyrin repeat-containing protein At2g01680-like [Triticum dicoccoides]|uniref:ankyrin repeat-containing protein At2g01680-like n=1 Tax=Triticum dicoccoides TaxID=85692 RepID=UPI00188F2C64|nr:ankyrin repeat-containing protein At2g01680-like [Triticum dicoccoides]
MVEMLLDWNKDLSKDKDKNGSTPLHTLVSAQSEDNLRIYCLDFPNMWHGLEKHATWRILDANPHAAYEKDKNGLLPVHIAALMDRMAAILILLKRCRGCVALRDKQGRSLLHIAVRNKVHRIVKYACQEPVFAPVVNARDNDGNTALHLAVEVENLVIFCHLMRNPKILLNVRNKKDETPLDLARSKKTLTNFSYAMNPENVIYKTLRDAGARHGRFWGDRVQQLCIQNELSSLKDEENRSEEGNDLEKRGKIEDGKKNRKKKEDEEKKDSDQLTDSTRTLGIGSVLITTMTFGATFALPSAVKATNNSPGVISGHLGAWYFDAFMMANTLTFICSSVATLCLMFSGMSMVKLQIRRMYFQVSVFLTSSSLTSLTVAFALGLHMVLASI